MRAIHPTFLTLASVGVVIIVRPAELGDHPLVNVMPVISAALFGQYIFLTRRLPRCHHPVELLFQDGVFAGIALSVAFFLSTVDGGQRYSQLARPCDDCHRTSNCRTARYNLVVDDG